MDDDPIVDRRVRCDDNRICGDSRADTGGDGTRGATLNSGGVCTSKDLSPTALHTAAKGREIFERMQLCLPGKMQAWTGIEARQRCACQQLHIVQSGALCGLAF